MHQHSPGQLVDHFFRYEYGNMVAVLMRVFGVRYFELIEDHVQSSLVEALQTWKTKGIPENPAGWIHRVARNRILDALRRDQVFQKISPQLAGPEWERDREPEWDESRLQDAVLRMIFTCCHPSLAPDSSIPLTLKSICGFSEREIAGGLLLSVDNVRKRIYRARQALMARNEPLEIPGPAELPDRLDVVHNVLYLMFNEGYLSAGEDEAIRHDVCEEAARLCHLLSEHPECGTRNTLALLALMLFHACRLPARVDEQGTPLLLEDQDRAKWDRRLLARAMEIFSEASRTDAPSNYHLEAAIAMYHCRADDVASTRWSEIVALYDRLIAQRPLPAYLLNRAIAVGRDQGPDAAIQLLAQIQDDPHLRRTHLLESAFGELYRQKNELEIAANYFQLALEKTHSPHDRTLLEKRLAQCDRPTG